MWLGRGIFPGELTNDDDNAIKNAYQKQDAAEDASGNHGEKSNAIENLLADFQIELFSAGAYCDFIVSRFELSFYEGCSYDIIGCHGCTGGFQNGDGGVGIKIPDAYGEPGGQAVFCCAEFIVGGDAGVFSPDGYSFRFV